MKINNRRYIGCKTKLLDFIYDSVVELGYDANNIFADIFAGTGVVGYKFATEGYKVILNDTLYSNIVAYYAWLGRGELRNEFLRDEINKINSFSSLPLTNNYFSNAYGGKYFSVEDARLIGYIRDYIEDNKNNYTEREYYYLIASLLYCTDKIANTVGHFESFLSQVPKTKGVKLSMLEIDDIQPADIYNKDANELSKHLKADIVYIDPPYNARQYVNFYHVLENLARWNKPNDFEGNSMKFKRNSLKSDYCRSKAPILFEDLINNLKCKLIVVSYNNTYKAGSISSVNTISNDQLISTLRKKGKVTVKSIDYKCFNAGKSELDGHKELLYICEVNK